MLAYIVKRILAMIPTLLGITFITFLIIKLAPGDPVAMNMGGGEGGESGGGGSEKLARQADAIKAKRKLLGILEPERVLRSWMPDLRDPEPQADGAPPRARSLVRLEPVGDFDAWPRALAADPKSGRVWTALADGTIHALNPVSPLGPDLTDFAAARVTKPGTDAPETIWRLTLSADGTRLATSDAAGRLRLLDSSTGKILRESMPVGRTMRSVAFLPDGSLVSACDDGRVRHHDGATLAVKREMTGHALHVSAVAASADGASAYSTGYDRKVRRWNLADGTATVIGELAGSGNAITVSPDGKLLAAGGDDRGALVFDISTAAAPAPVLHRFVGAHTRAVTAIAFVDGGKGLVTASKDGALRCWRLSDGIEASEAPDSTNGQVYAIAETAGGVLLTASESDRQTALLKQYGTWLSKTIRLDFDRSFIDDEKVIDKIKQSLPITLGLNFLAILIAYIVAIPVGVASAVRRGQAFDRVSSIVMFLLWALPNFWFATMLIQWFSSRNHFDIFPSVGLESANAADLSYLQSIGDRASHIVLPLVVMTYASFTLLSQFMRSSVLDSIAQDYIRTARAKGLSERVVVYKHALRNSLVTLVTLVGSLLPGLIGGSVIVERIFTINGMGNMGFEAIQTRDYPVIMAITTLSAVLTLVGVLISDILYAVVDPRISHK